MGIYEVTKDIGYLEKRIDVLEEALRQLCKRSNLHFNAWQEAEYIEEIPKEETIL